MVVPATSHIRRRSKSVASSNTSRLSTSSGAKKVVLLRSPLLLEWTDSFVRAGLVDRPTPMYMVPKPQWETMTNNNMSTTTTATAEQMYLHYSSMMQSVFDHLGLEAKDRWAVVVMSTGGIHWNRNLEDALSRMLADQGVEAYTIIPAMELVPYAFPPRSVVGDMLIVQVTNDEAHCVAFASGHALEYTYQATGKVVMTMTSQGNDLSCFQALKDAFLLENSPHSLIMSIIKCILACPRDARKNVIENMVFVGFIPDPDFGRQVALKVQASIRGAPTTEAASKGAVPSETVSEEEQENDPASSTITSEQQQQQQQAVFTAIPVEMKALQPLAASVSVLEVKCCRPDLLSWLGACVWTNHWHGLDPESAHFQWKTL